VIYGHLRSYDVHVLEQHGVLCEVGKSVQFYFTVCQKATVSVRAVKSTAMGKHDQH